MTRKVLGRPGSVRRWLLGSAFVIALCAILYVRVDFLGKIIVFILGAFFVFAAWRARSFVIGDEDEFRASVRREMFHKRSAETEDEPVLHDQHDQHDSDELHQSLSSLEGRFGDAPPPPILDGRDPDE